MKREQSKGGGGNAPNPAQDAPTRQRRGGRPGSLRQVRLRLWWAITDAADLLESADEQTRLRAISAMSTAAGVYAKLTETDELERRLADLEKTVKQEAPGRLRA